MHLHSASSFHGNDGFPPFGLPLLMLSPAPPPFPHPFSVRNPRVFAVRTTARTHMPSPRRLSASPVLGSPRRRLDSSMHVPGILRHPNVCSA